jgi:hypothetical protein
MIAMIPYLQKFVNNLPEANQGKAFYRIKRTWRDDFEDYESNCKRGLKKITESYN